MEFKEYQERRRRLSRQLNELEIEYVKSKTKLEIGDTVNFVEEGDYYISEKDTRHSAEIQNFEVCSDGRILVHCKGVHYTPLIENVTKNYYKS